MCFIVDEKNPYKLIAEEDRVCYKVLRNDIGKMVSPFKNFEYQLNELNILSEPLRITHAEFDNIIAVGFHSYTKLREAVLNSHHESLIVKCIIPKGAEFFIDNYYEEYVSNQIIIKEVLTQVNRTKSLKEY
jgi:hypothetical protein